MNSLIKKSVSLILASAIILLSAFATGAYSETFTNEEEKYHYYTHEGKAVFCEYYGDSEKFEVPAYLGGYPVAEIDSYSFKNCENLCEVVLPETLELIDYNAFSECDNLKSIYIPAAVTEITCSAFSGCDSIESIVVSSDNVVYDSRDNCNAIIETATNTLVAVCANTVIPDSIKAIGEQAFSGNKELRSIELPQGIEKIGDSAFADCTNLFDVTLPDTLKVMGERVFSNCASLAQLSVPDSVETIGEAAFYNCKNLTDVTLSRNLQNIEDKTFAECAALKSITIPSSVDTIGTQAFYFCEGLREAVICDGVTTIKYDAFCANSRLTFLYLPSSLTFVDGYAFRYSDAISHIVFSGTKDQLDQLTNLSSSYALIHYETHNTMSVTEEVLPTCEKDGYRISKCSECEAEYRRGLYPHTALDKNLEYVESVERTCFEDGYDIFKCSLCGLSVKLNMELAKGHKNFNKKCEYCNNKDELLKSPHPYKNNCNDRWTLTQPGATSITITFSEDTETEENTDFIQIYDQNDKLKGEYSGTELAGKSVTVYGETICISLISDESYVRYGFELTDVKASYDPVATYDEPPLTTEPTLPDENGGYYLFDNEIFSGSYYFEEYDYSHFSVNPESNSVGIVNHKQSEYNLLTNDFSCADNYSVDGACGRYISQNKIYLLKTKYDDYHNKYYCVEVFDTNNRFIESINLNYPYEFSAIGVDLNDRIYLYGFNFESDEKVIYLLDDKGNALNVTPIENEIYSFAAFDENGTFYTVVNTSYISDTGDEREARGLCAGVVSNADNSLVYSEKPICLLSDYYQFGRYNAVKLLGDNYLAVDSEMNGNLRVFDISGFTGENSEIREIFTVSRSKYQKISRVGVGAVYYQDKDALLVCTDNRTVTQFKMSTGEIVCTINTQNNLYDIFSFNDRLMIVERNNDGEYFYRIIPIAADIEISVEADSFSLRLGEELQLKASVNSPYEFTYLWSSDNPQVASITENGVVFGWEKGTANITAKITEEIYCTVEVVVYDDSADKPASSIAKVKKRFVNENSNNYFDIALPVYTYMVENPDGTITLVSADSKKVFIDTYSADFTEPLSETEIENPLSLFGGFYSAEEYNFIVFGQPNFYETDNCEVIRVVKYSKNWEYLDCVSVYGRNTVCPFDAGSLRMTEAYGKLYIHTAHLMYQSSDGRNHQANMSIVIDVDTTQMIYCHYGIANLNDSGYVSHSFNQFAVADDEYLFRVDHGDGYPRGFSIARSNLSDGIADVDYIIPIEFPGATGENYTGASVGGVELSTDNIIIAANLYAGENYTNYLRNIILIISDKSLENSRLITVTDYEEYDGTLVCTPHLVKIGSDQFLIMWEEWKDWEYANTKMVCVDSSGELISDIITVKAPLSDCKPVFTSDQLVKWYVSNGINGVVYSVNPYKLNEISSDFGEIESNTEPETEPGTTENNTGSDNPSEGFDSDYIVGDVNSDSKVNVKDATEIQKYLANLTTLDSTSLLAADADKNDKINIKDATLIQKYSAKIVDSL